MTWSRHSLRIEPISLSAYPFCQGERGDVGRSRANKDLAIDVDLAGDRRLMLRHAVVKGAQLNEVDAKRVLQHLADLWTYDVSLVEVDATETVLKEHVVSPRRHAVAA